MELTTTSSSSDILALSSRGKTQERLSVLAVSRSRLAPDAKPLRKENSDTFVIGCLNDEESKFVAQDIAHH